MNVAELFVRVTGDTSDVTAKLAGAQRSLDGFGAASNRASQAAEGHKLSLGRVERALASYVGHAAGANAVTESLSVAFGSFAVGGGVVAGVLLGVGAIIAIYEKMTEGTKAATKAQDDLIDALEKTLHLKSLGPGGVVVDQTQAAKDRAAALGVEIANLDKLLVKDAMDADVVASNLVIQEKINKLVIERQSALNAAAGGQGIINEAVSAATGTAPSGPKEAVGKFNELRDAADRVNKQLTEDAKNFWRDYIDKQNEALTIWQQIANAENAKRPSIVEIVQGMVSGPGVGPVDISDSVKIAGDQAKKINEAAERHAQMIRDAVWGAALNSANIIVGALNVGGGGKGSQLGGALGSTAGFVIGTPGGPIGQAIGSTVGNIIGSFVGGLFDNSQATRDNTNATRQLVSALLQNTPSGFRVESYRYNASDVVKQFQKDYSRYKTRGGPNLNAA